MNNSYFNGLPGAPGTTERLSDILEFIQEVDSYRSATNVTMSHPDFVPALISDSQEVLHQTRAELGGHEFETARISEKLRWCSAAAGEASARVRRADALLARVRAAQACLAEREEALESISEFSRVLVGLEDGLGERLLSSTLSGDYNGELVSCNEGLAVDLSGVDSNLCTKRLGRLCAVFPELLTVSSKVSPGPQEWNPEQSGEKWCINEEASRILRVEPEELSETQRRAVALTVRLALVTSLRRAMRRAAAVPDNGEEMLAHAQFLLSVPGVSAHDVLQTHLELLNSRVLRELCKEEAKEKSTGALSEALADAKTLKVSAPRLGARASATERITVAVEGLIPFMDKELVSLRDVYGVTAPIEFLNYIHSKCFVPFVTPIIAKFVADNRSNSSLPAAPRVKAAEHSGEPPLRPSRVVLAGISAVSFPDAARRLDRALSDATALASAIGVYMTYISTTHARLIISARRTEKLLNDREYKTPQSDALNRTIADLSSFIVTLQGAHFAVTLEHAITSEQERLEEYANVILATSQHNRPQKSTAGSVGMPNTPTSFFAGLLSGAGGNKAASVSASVSNLSSTEGLRDSGHEGQLSHSPVPTLVFVEDIFYLVRLVLHRAFETRLPSVAEGVTAVAVETVAALGQRMWLLIAPASAGGGAFSLTDATTDKICLVPREDSLPILLRIGGGDVVSDRAPLTALLRALPAVAQEAITREHGVTAAIVAKWIMSMFTVANYCRHLQGDLDVHNAIKHDEGHESEIVDTEFNKGEHGTKPQTTTVPVSIDHGETNDDCLPAGTKETKPINFILHHDSLLHVLPSEKISEFKGRLEKLGNLVDENAKLLLWKAVAKPNASVMVSGLTPFVSQSYILHSDSSPSDGKHTVSISGVQSRATLQTSWVTDMLKSWDAVLRTIRAPVEADADLCGTPAADLYFDLVLNYITKMVVETIEHELLPSAVLPDHANPGAPRFWLSVGTSQRWRTGGGGTMGSSSGTVIAAGKSMDLYGALKFDGELRAIKKFFFEASENAESFSVRERFIRLSTFAAALCAEDPGDLRQVVVESRVASGRGSEGVWGGAEQVPEGVLQGLMKLRVGWKG